jgi:hypothetical protein
MTPLRPIIIVVAVCSLPAIAFTQTATTADASPPVVPISHVELFNGKDFTGWTFFMRTNADPKLTWSIADGLIKCTGTPTGYLRTEKNYQNYKVTVEWRFTKAGNTGVMVHINGTDKVWPNCIECQGMHDHQGDFWLQGGATCKEPANLGKNGIKMPNPSSENPVGEWNTFTSICTGETVEIVVNGKSMNKITGCSSSSGTIGIQSEGAGIEIRKISLDPAS